MSKDKSQNYEFQSEVKQLLHILVFSLYKHKEIFLRELISNAVDALNRIKFKSLTDTEIENKDLELKIDISFNKTQKKLIIEDTGIGMSKNELIENIGTIAHSGTIDFLKKITESKEKEQLNLIGQFGVGFYSSFMVAKEIRIYTKSFEKNSIGLLWKSGGDNNYTIEESVKKSRGTRIELFLKKEEDGFLEKFRIKSIIEKHSSFIPFPIYLEKEKLEATEAIWTQPKSSLKEKDYNDFFKFIENSSEAPLSYLHLSSDAPVQFNAILYIPKSSMESLGFVKDQPGVDLYSKKVLIQKGNKDIFPEYLRFMKGIIDSEEIPLNISRETIQSNVKIEKIKKYILKKLFTHLEKIKQNDKEKYTKIWNSFNKNFKEGIISDFGSREKIAPLLVFSSSKTREKEETDFNEYMERMQKDQKEIYYSMGTDGDTDKYNPALEAFKKKDVEVLYLSNPLDEFVFEHLREYKGTKFQVIDSADIQIDQEDKKEDKDYLKKVDSFITYLKTIYQEKVSDVKISKRLIDSTCMLSRPTDGPSAQMEKIIKMTNKEYQFSKRLLEINPDNALIKEMVRIHGKDPASSNLKNLAFQMLDNMMLREGIIENIDAIIPRIQDIMLDAATKY